MSLYKEIKKFDSYFNSVRIHEGLLIVDVILPTGWEDKDLEEKNHLLNLKILELKKMFSENDVNSLRKLDFSFNKLDLEINGQEQLSKLVPEGVNQGQKGSN